MRADVLQVVALCCHGNAFLQGKSGNRAPELASSNSLFKPVQDLSFTRNAGNALAAGVLAGGVSPWLNRLKSEGVEELRLFLENCTIDTKRRTENAWGILSDGDVGLELWRPSWKGVLVRYHQENSWTVSYSSTRYNRWALRAPTDFETSITNLDRELAAVEVYCRQQLMVKISDAVATIRAMSHRPFDPDPDYPDLYPESTEPWQRTLLAMGLGGVKLVSCQDWAEGIIAGDETIKQSTLKIWKAAMAAFESAVTGHLLAAAHSSPAPPNSPKVA